MTISVWIIKFFHEPTSHIKKVCVSLVLWCVIIFLLKIILSGVQLSENDYLNSNSKVLGLNIPINLDFAGERVPQNDYEIKESLEAEFFSNKSWKNSSLVLFQKAQNWFN